MGNTKGIKPLVIFHADCQDGYGAALAAWLKLGDEAEYLSCQYGRDTLDPSKVQYEDREVYVLDFSFPREAMDRLFAHAKRVVWLDHHKTAFEMWEVPANQHVYVEDRCELEEGEIVGHYLKLSMNKSGALLAWEYFHPGIEVPMLIQHIDDRDRWQWKLEGSAEIHAALGSLKPWDFEQWDEIYTSESFPEHEAGSFHALKQQGTAILRAQKQHVEQMAKQAQRVKIEKDETQYEPWIGLAVNASLHQSEVGHELANASGTFGLVWYVASDNRVRCSLRSNGEYDVSAIARAFGGGGHRNAAGFETDIETLMSWLT